MRILFNRIGTPIIKDCNEEYFVINPSFISNDELQYFPAIEQILNLFTEGHDCCDMLCWCQQSIHNNGNGVRIIIYVLMLLCGNIGTYLDILRKKLNKSIRFYKRFKFRGIAISLIATATYLPHHGTRSQAKSVSFLRLA